MKSVGNMLRSPAAVFATGSYFAILLNLAQGVLFMKILTVEQYGVWLSLLLLFRYGQQSHLGAVQSVLRQLPLLKGQGNSHLVDEYAASGRGLTVLANLGWALIGVLLVWRFYAGVWIGGLTLVLVTGMETWWHLGVAELKTQHRFGVVASAISARSALNLFLLPLVIWMGLEGAYLRWVLLMSVMLFLVWKRNPLARGVRFDREDFRKILVDGGPILIVGMVLAFQTSIDQTLIFLNLGEAELGRYGVAALLMTIMMVIPSAVGQTAYPRMLEQYGRDGDIAALFPAVRRRILLVTVASAAIAALGAVAMGFVVGLILPKYLPGVPPARLILPGGVFLAASVPASDFLVTIREPFLHLRVSIVAFAVQLIACLSAIHWGKGIEGVALATTFSLAVYAGLLILVSTLQVRRHRGAQPVR